MCPKQKASLLKPAEEARELKKKYEEVKKFYLYSRRCCPNLSS
jgi:hypothetical protein